MLFKNNKTTQQQQKQEKFGKFDIQITFNIEDLPDDESRGDVAVECERPRAAPPRRRDAPAVASKPNDAAMRLCSGPAVRFESLSEWRLSRCASA